MLAQSMISSFTLPSPTPGSPPNSRKSPSISSLLNDPKPESLPTPVTPASVLPIVDLLVSPSSSSPSSDGAASPVAYQNHDSHEIGTTNKPFVCHECDQTFSRPHNLKSHLTTHSPVRPFQCDICMHQFRRQHDLKRHKKSHLNERPYACKYCSRTFTRLDALNRHQRTENGVSACASKKVKAEAKSGVQPPPQRQQLPLTPPSQQHHRTISIPPLPIPFSAAVSSPLSQQQHDNHHPIVLPSPSPAFSSSTTTASIISPPPPNMHALERENWDLKVQIARCKEAHDQDMILLRKQIDELQSENNKLRSIIYSRRSESSP